MFLVFFHDDGEIFAALDIYILRSFLCACVHEFFDSLILAMRPKTYILDKCTQIFFGIITIENFLMERAGASLSQTWNQLLL